MKESYSGGIGPRFAFRLLLIPLFINNGFVMIYLGSDHAGFELKEKIKEYLNQKGLEVEDLGAHTLDKNDDYPDYAKPVAEKVAANPENRGILFCGSAEGFC